jgi:hypothetical protein
MLARKHPIVIAVLQCSTCNCIFVRRDHQDVDQRYRYLLPERSTNAYIDKSKGCLASLGRRVNVQSGLMHEPSHLSVRMSLSVGKKSRPKAMRDLKQWS